MLLNFRFICQTDVFHTI